MNGEHIRLRGVVQGVGFRAAVEALAERYGLRGWVRNDGADVLVAVVGESEEHDAFLQALLKSLPSRARVEHVERTPVDLPPATGFAVAPTRR